MNALHCDLINYIDIIACIHSPTVVCCPFLGRLAEFTDVAIGHTYYMERQRRGIKKIIENYETEPNYSAELKPEFFSDSSQFSVVLKNLNYGKSIEKLAIMQSIV